jgi:AcrR family transcriptional regulator
MSRRPDERPTVLVEVAKNHFLKHGLQNANLRSIAKDAGLTTGAVYHHFSGKDELFVEVCLQGYQILLERLDAAAKLTQGRPPRDRILAYLDAYLGFFVEKSGYFDLIERFERSATLLRIPSDLRERTHAAQKRLMDLIRRAIGEDLPNCAAKAELLAALGQGFIQRMRSHAFEQAGVSVGQVRELLGDIVQSLVDR